MSKEPRVKFKGVDIQIHIPKEFGIVSGDKLLPYSAGLYLSSEKDIRELFEDTTPVGEFFKGVLDGAKSA